MLVNGYIDESYNQKFFIMAGYVGKLGRWSRFDELWGRLLRRYDLRYFHSKEMVDRDNDFAGWTPAKEQEFCARAEALSDKYPICGFVTRVDYRDYKKHYREYNTIKGYHLDSIYGLAFRYILAYIPEFVARTLKRDDVCINFILETGHKNFGDALRIINEMKERVPSVGRFLGTVIPGDKSVPGCQVADALATGAFRLEPTAPRLINFPQEIATRKDLLKAKTAKGIPVIRCHPTPEELRGFKDAVLELRQYRQRHWEEVRAERAAAKANPISASPPALLVSTAVE